MHSKKITCTILIIFSENDHNSSGYTSNGFISMKMAVTFDIHIFTKMTFFVSSHTVSSFFKTFIVPYESYYALQQFLVLIFLNFT